VVVSLAKGNGEIGQAFDSATSTLLQHATHWRSSGFRLLGIPSFALLRLPRFRFDRLRILGLDNPIKLGESTAR
jgi:hypothetical protein